MDSVCKNFVSVNHHRQTKGSSLQVFHSFHMQSTLEQPGAQGILVISTEKDYSDIQYITMKTGH